MPKGPTKRRPETRARLLTAASQAFAELGFGGASIDEICKRAGYTTGAYYSNFASKDELFFVLFEEHASKLIESLSTRLTEVDAPQSWPEAVDAFLGDLGPDERTWFMVSTEFTMYAVRNPDAAVLLAEHDAKVRAHLVETLEGFFARAGRRPSVELDELARMMVAIREGALMQSLVEPEALPAGTLERTYIPVLLEAMSEKGA